MTMETRNGGGKAAATGTVIEIRPQATREDANRAISECREKAREYVERLCRENDIFPPVCDLSFGLFDVRDGNPYDYIANTAKYVHCMLLDAWRFAIDCTKCRRELAEVKGRPIEDAAAVLLCGKNEASDEK